jgi:hypothetical protein
MGLGLKGKRSLSSFRNSCYRLKGELALVRYPNVQLAVFKKEIF